jgi:hypothetical protein
MSLQPLGLSNPLSGIIKTLGLEPGVHRQDLRSDPKPPKELSLFQGLGSVVSNNFSDLFNVKDIVGFNGQKVNSNSGGISNGQGNNNGGIGKMILNLVEKGLGIELPGFLKGLLGLN